MPKTKPIRLKLGGADFCLARSGNATHRILAFLNNLPPNELRTGRELAAEIGISACWLRALAVNAALRDRRQIIPPRLCVWGNPRAIAELRRQMGWGVSK